MTQQVIYLGKKFNTSKVFVDDIDNEKKLRQFFPFEIQCLCDKFLSTS